jgi:hypothetical protein
VYCDSLRYSVSWISCIWNDSYTFKLGSIDMFEAWMFVFGLQVQTGSFESYIDAALYIVDIWAMNKLQSQALLQPFKFLQRYKTGEYEQEEPQYFNYIGGAGGTGKSGVIGAFCDVFRVKDYEKEILITELASSGNAAAKILLTVQ